MEPEVLLRTYNPLLVLLPQDTSRHRPWSRWYRKVDAPRGDYHPCSVDFFLSYAYQRPKPRPWSLLALFRKSPLPDPLGLEGLKALLNPPPDDGSSGWELDVAPIRSQKPDQAWSAYAGMLEQMPWEHSACVYGRYVAGPPAVLQYWYLYTYNDAPNRHEGDWEMVAIELGDGGTPRRAGYAGHAGGFRRPWSRVELKDGRPVVYVSRGSHAAYFEHRPDGHRANSLDHRKGWPEPFESLWGRFVRTLQDVFFFLRIVDHTPDNPEHPAGEPRDRGVLVEPQLFCFPSQSLSDPDFWWMGLDSRWGSQHSRLEGTIGPNPPWRQEDKWQEPSKWLETLVDE